jgi:uncharacterized protein YjbI with pentapeptide repeats
MADNEEVRLLKSSVVKWNKSFYKRSRASVNLIGAELGNSRFDGADLSMLDLRVANFSRSVLKGVDFRATNLSGANFVNCNLTGANLSGAKSPGSCFVDSDLVGVIANGINLVGADLSHTNLSNANLSDANLTRANFNDALLRNTKLVGACLNGASVVGANLSHADLSNSLARKSNFSQSDLSGSNLAGADLSGALLHNIVYDEFTRWPVGFTPPANGSISNTFKATDHVSIRDLHLESVELPSTIALGNLARSAEPLIQHVEHALHRGAWSDFPYLEGQVVRDLEYVRAELFETDPSDWVGPVLGGVVARLERNMLGVLDELSDESRALASGLVNAVASDDPGKVAAAVHQFVESVDWSTDDLVDPQQGDLLAIMGPGRFVRAALRWGFDAPKDALSGIGSITTAGSAAGAGLGFIVSMVTKYSVLGAVGTMTAAGLVFGAIVSLSLSYLSARWRVTGEDYSKKETPE